MHLMPPPPMGFSPIHPHQVSNLFYEHTCINSRNWQFYGQAPPDTCMRPRLITVYQAALNSKFFKVPDYDHIPKVPLTDIILQMLLTMITPPGDL